MIIDFHTHCFPEKIAEKAIDTLSNAGAMLSTTDGTKEGLLKAMDEDGVDISVVLQIATNERQQRAVNDFASSINGDRIIAFGSVHPDALDALDELERISDMGITGVKFHPEYQNFFVDDIKMKPIYRKISDLGLITVFHAGEDVGYRGPYHCMPENLERALEWFNSPVVAAHWGGHNLGEEVIKRLCGKDVYFDMAFGYGNIAKPVAQKIIEKHGTDRILFGSDSPWHRAKWEQIMVEFLDLSKEDKEKIYYKNAKKILNLEVERNVLQ